MTPRSTARPPLNEGPSLRASAPVASIGKTRDPQRLQVQAMAGSRQLGCDGARLKDCGKEKPACLPRSARAGAITGVLATLLCSMDSRRYSASHQLLTSNHFGLVACAWQLFFIEARPPTKTHCQRLIRLVSCDASRPSLRLETAAMRAARRDVPLVPSGAKGRARHIYHGN